MVMQRRVGLFVLLLAIVTIVVPTDLPTTDAAVPGIYWGAHMYGRPPDAFAFEPGGFIHNFENNIAKKPMSIIAWGAPWEYPTGTMLRFQTTYFNNVRNHGSIPMLDWGSWACCGPDQPKYKLSNIVRGDFDAFITQWARDAKAWKYPFFLRFNWEMNGNWQFPWSAQLNGNTPRDYINAWRHVKRIFNKVGATNATFVWAPNISSWNTVPMAQVYPGASFVDWIGLDAYNFAANQNMPWMSFEQVLAGDRTLVSNSQNSYNQITRLAPGKPLIITEFASIEAGDGGTMKGQWVTEALTNTIIKRFPRIKAIVWFNWADGGHSWPVESTQASQNAFATAISNKIYLGNVFANLPRGKVRARR